MAFLSGLEEASRLERRQPLTGDEQEAALRSYQGDADAVTNRVAVLTGGRPAVSHNRDIAPAGDSGSRRTPHR